MWKLLDPSVVSGHLAVGLLLFATFVTLATLALTPRADEHALHPAPMRPADLLPLFTLATLLVWFRCSAAW